MDTFKSKNINIKVNFLEREFKETMVRAEAAERNCAVLRNTMMETEAEINKWSTKIKEMEDQMVLMDDVADDPAYAFDMTALGEGDGRETPTSFNDRAQMFQKQAEERARSRSDSRASSVSEQPPTPQPDVEPEADPEPEAGEPDEDEEEEGEEEEVKAETVTEVESAPPAPAEPAAEQEEEEEEEEEEDEDDDGW